MLRMCLVSSPSSCLLYRNSYQSVRASQSSDVRFRKRAMKNMKNEVSSLFFLSRRECCSSEGTIQVPSVNAGPLSWKLGRIIPLTNQDSVAYCFVDILCLAHPRTKPRLLLHHILFIGVPLLCIPMFSCLILSLRDEVPSRYVRQILVDAVA